MAEPKHNHGERYLRYVVIALAFLLALLVGLLVLQYFWLQAQYHLNMSERQFLRSRILESHAPLPVSEANVIRSWMTFDYINRVFALPSGYLEKQLQVTDSRYPHLTLATYASSKKIDQSLFTNDVENVVQNYVAPK